MYSSSLLEVEYQPAQTRVKTIDSPAVCRLIWVHGDDVIFYFSPALYKQEYFYARMLLIPQLPKIFLVHREITLGFGC